MATGDDTAAAAEMDDSLSMALLVVLETLTPIERAVFLLREVFDYPYDQIAHIVDRTPATCRQLQVRARRRVHQRRRRFDISPQRQQQLEQRFLAAIGDGELDHLVDLLAEDAAFYGDGGGKGHGLPRPVFGKQRVARLLTGIARRYHQFHAELQPACINGGPGLLAFTSDGRLINVFVLEQADETIKTIRSIINPDKLRHLGHPLLDAPAGPSLPPTPNA